MVYVLVIVSLIRLLSELPSELIVAQAGEVAMPEGDDVVAPAAGPTAADAAEEGNAAQGEAPFPCYRILVPGRLVPWYRLVSIAASY